MTNADDRVELIARVCAAIAPVLDGTLEIGPVKVDFEQRLCYVAGRDTELTPAEFEIFALLFLELNHVVSYARFMGMRWDGQPGSLSKGALRRHMVGLRRKLGPYGSLIDTVREVGFRMQPPEQRLEGGTYDESGRVHLYHPAGLELCEVAVIN